MSGPSAYAGTASPTEERHRRAEAIGYGRDRTAFDVHTTDTIRAYWAAEIRGRLRRDKDAVMLWWGPPGCGKSTGVMDLMRAVDETFTPDVLRQRVAFHAADVPLLYDTPRYGAAWIDEGGSAGLLATDTRTGDQRDLVELVNIIRAKNVFLNVVIPDPGDLAKSFRARRADYRVECEELVEGMPAVAHVARRVRVRRFFMDDGRWLGFSDDPRANPYSWPEYRDSPDPTRRAFWAAYQPLKMKFLGERTRTLAARMRAREERRATEDE